MADILQFQKRPHEEFRTEDMLAYRQFIQFQLQATRDYAEPLLETLAWIDYKLAAKNAGQLSLPLITNVEDIFDESHFSIKN